jgi:hypothetical protein
LRHGEWHLRFCIAARSACHFAALLPGIAGIRRRIRSVKKTCVHIAHPDGQRLIPFDTYNLFYRDGLEETVLGPLRRERMAVAGV